MIHNILTTEQLPDGRPFIVAWDTENGTLSYPNGTDCGGYCAMLAPLQEAVSGRIIHSWPTCIWQSSGDLRQPVTVLAVLEAAGFSPWPTPRPGQAGYFRGMTLPAPLAAVTVPWRSIRQDWDGDPNRTVC